MKITIEKATLSEAQDIGLLFDNYRVFYNQPSNLTASIDFISQRIYNNESVIYCAFSEDKEMVGFTQLYPIFSSTRLKKAWLLNDLFVSPDYRGKNISVQLIEAAKNLCKSTNAHGIMLETQKSNFIGNNLYPKVGFKLSNTTTNFYEWTVS